MIQRGFLRSPPTQDPQPTQRLTGTGLSPSVVRFPKRFPFAPVFDVGSYYPRLAVTRLVWAVPRSLATTQGITTCFLFLRLLRCFSSPRLPPSPGTGSSNQWVAPFGYQRISPCQRVPVMFRRLPRPSSPPEAIGIPQTPFCCVHTLRPTLRNGLPQCSPDSACFLSQSWTATVVPAHRSPRRSKNNVPQRPKPTRPCLDKQSAHNATPQRTGYCPPTGSRKEVFQPHLPVRLPCYDLAPVAGFTLVRLAPRTSGPPNSHGLTGGVYKVRERIHRAMADARLLAIPAS